MHPIRHTRRLFPEKTIRRVKAKLFLSGITNHDIAAAAQPPVKISTVRGVLGGFQKSSNVMRAVSRLLGETVERTWGKAA